MPGWDSSFSCHWKRIWESALCLNCLAIFSKGCIWAFIQTNCVRLVHCNISKRLKLCECYLIFSFKEGRYEESYSGVFEEDVSWQNIQLWPQDGISYVCERNHLSTLDWTFEQQEPLEPTLYPADMDCQSNWKQAKAFAGHQLTTVFGSIGCLGNSRKVGGKALSNSSGFGYVDVCRWYNQPTILQTNTKHKQISFEDSLGFVSGQDYPWSAQVLELREVSCLPLWVVGKDFFFKWNFKQKFSSTGEKQAEGQAEPINKFQLVPAGHCLIRKYRHYWIIL